MSEGKQQQQQHGSADAAQPVAPVRTRVAETLAGAFGGCVAGPVVDIALYPIDTVKTRLQSAEGFFKAGGFKGVYRGLSSAALGSAPAGTSSWKGRERQGGGDEKRRR